MTTNLWVEQFWFDHKLVWEPDDFGGVSKEVVEELTLMVILAG